jgi:hypothetical protein
MILPLLRNPRLVATVFPPQVVAHHRSESFSDTVKKECLRKIRFRPLASGTEKAKCWPIWSGI